MVKRGIDIVVSGSLLLFSSPFLVLVAFLVRMSSPGPVVFRQVRMGRGLRPFEILKFRTMAHAVPGLPYTIGRDPRITPAGKWLRRTKVDELPQLWNVFRGDMSLVGSRPVVPQLTREFPAQYALLLLFRPGLTDPASLKYSQEAYLLSTADDPMNFFKTVVTPDKIRLSLEYQRRANTWNDLVILMMTFLVCCDPTLGRVYGTLPMAQRTRGKVSEWQSILKARVLEPEEAPSYPKLKSVGQSTGSSGEEHRLPWNLLPIPNPRQQTTVEPPLKAGSHL